MNSQVSSTLWSSFNASISLPTMIIAVGGIVAMCVISMFLPMIKIVTVMTV